MPRSGTCWVALSRCFHATLRAPKAPVPPKFAKRVGGRGSISKLINYFEMEPRSPEHSRIFYGSGASVAEERSDGAKRSGAAFRGPASGHKTASPSSLPSERSERTHQLHVAYVRTRASEASGLSSLLAVHKTPLRNFKLIKFWASFKATLSHFKSRPILKFLS